MLVAHLLLGLLSGLVAAVLGLVLGYSVWATLGWFVLAGNAGLLISALVAYLARSGRGRRHAQRPDLGSALSRSKKVHHPPAQ